MLSIMRRFGNVAFRHVPIHHKYVGISHGFDLVSEENENEILCHYDVYLDLTRPNVQNFRFEEDLQFHSNQFYHQQFSNKFVTLLRSQLRFRRCIAG